jgi:GTP-binding protein EngB required for normal cell division
VPAGTDRGSGIAASMAIEPLERLFVRCHRDELLPLAELVGVTHRGVGLDLLARNLSRATRRLVRHGLLNALFAGGEGPDWLTVLRELSGNRKLGFDELSEAEVQIVRQAREESWVGLSAEARLELWRHLGMDGTPPSSGSEAMARAESSLGRAFGYVLTQTRDGVTTSRRFPAVLIFAFLPFGWILQPIIILSILLGANRALRADRPRLVTMVMHVARLRQIVLRRITVGFVGSPSTGKDAGIRAIFGIDSGNISPVAGSTRTVNIQQVPGATALYVVNTPGLGDVVQSVTDEAKQVLSHIDVYLYVVNAEGGVQAREQADYRACKATGKPVLALVNKVDLLRPRDVDRYLADARQKLGAAEEDFMPVAFDPMPELSPTPIGLAAVRAWLVAALVSLDKDPAELPTLPHAGLPGT